MNGFADHGLESHNFDVKGGGIGDGLRTFDAFPKTKATYTTRHARGGQWTVILLLTCAVLSWSELRAWYHGQESHQFSVEKGVGHILQINLDVVVAMHCDDLHVNVQDASRDLILAGTMLQRDETRWARWRDARDVHSLGAAGFDGGNHDIDDGDHVEDVLAHTAGRRKKFHKTPKLRGPGDACRIFGSMELNKVQGDFHITARGHGYAEWGTHLDHSAFNFSHIINELSFGPFYSSLHNPLDATVATTASHFFRFQYYLSVVPTIYTTARQPSSSSSDSAIPSSRTSKDTVFTNQYAVTEKSHPVGERSVPGVFFKFDIEPILLLIRRSRPPLLRLLVRLVNVVSGVLVAGGWTYLLADWVGYQLVKRRRDHGASSAGVFGWIGATSSTGFGARRADEGVIHGRKGLDGYED